MVLDLKHKLKLFSLLVILVICGAVLVPRGAEAATFTSTKSGFWNIGTTWGGSCTVSCTAGTHYPGSSDTGVIADTHTVTINANAGTVGAITINAGGILTYSGTRTMTVSGAFNINGTYTLNTNAVRTYVGAVTINSGGNWNNTGNSTSVFRGGVVLNTGGTFTSGTGVQTFNTNNQAISGTAGAISIGSLTTATSNKTVTFTGMDVTVTNLVVASATSIDMSTGSLTVNGTTSLTGTITDSSTTNKSTNVFTGLVTVNSGGVFNLTTGNPNTNFAGGIAMSGTTFTPGTGTVTFTGDESLTGANNMTFGGAVTVDTGHTLTNSNTGTVAITGLLTLTGNWTQGVNSLLTLGASTPMSGAGTFNATTNVNTVTFSTTGAQTIPAKNYYDLTFAGAHTTNNVTLASGTIGVAGALTNSTTFTGAGAFVTTGNTISFNGTGAQSVIPTSATFKYNILTIDKASGTATLTGDVTTTGAVNFTQGTFDQGASYGLTTGGNITVGASGIWTNTGTGAITLGGNVANAGTGTISSGNLAQCTDGTDSIVISSTGGTLRTWSKSGAGAYTIRNVSATNMADSGVTAYTSNLGTGTTWATGICPAPPTVALNTPINTATAQSTTPVLNFTGTDINGDTIEYNVQVDTANTFDSQASLATPTITYNTAGSGANIQTSGTSVSVTGRTWNEGDLIVAVVTQKASPYGPAATPITDTMGNTWSSDDLNITQGSTWSVRYYHTIVAPGKGGGPIDITFTATGGVADYINLTVHSFTSSTGWLPTASTKDKANSVIGTSQPANGPSFSIPSSGLFSQANELLVGHYGDYMGSPSDLSGWSTGFLEDGNKTYYKVITSTSAVTFNPTDSTNNAHLYDGAVVSYMPRTAAASYSDSFTLTNQNPLSNGGKWVTQNGFQALQVVSNQVKGTLGNADNGAIWTNDISGSDQYSQFTYRASDSSSDVGAILRGSASTKTAYYAAVQYDGVSAWRIDVQKWVGGIYSDVGIISISAPVSGDIHKFKIVGTTLTYYINGAAQGSPLTDSSIVSGYPGVYAGGTNGILDDWSGGDISVGTSPLINATSATGDTAFTANHPFTSGQAKDYTVQSALTPSTTYYWRVRGIDPGGTNTYGAWSSTYSFTPATSPTVTTQSATSVTATSAVLNGNITVTGGANATSRGFAWGTSATMVGDTATTTDTVGAPFSTGAFTGDPGTLVCNTTYYSRAYATNARGTSLGAISASFTTSACPTTTTLATGTDPSTTTVAPGSAIVDAGAFTLAASSGTDSITKLTVQLAGSGTPYSGLSEVRITSDNGVTTYFTATTTLVRNDIYFSGGTPIPVSTTPTQFKIRITPLSHALMPPVPGASYDLSAYVSGWTGTNTHAGTDANSNTLTIDNTSPNNVTSAAATAGNTQVSFTWANPADTDFTTGGTVVVLRRATSDVADVPVEGATYIVGDTIGTATVACVVAGSPPTASCTNTGLTNGTVYYYKIFTKDSRGNYSQTGTAPTGSPATPRTIPTVTTQDASSVTATSAVLNGNITVTGGAGPTVRGFAWGTNANLSGGDTATTTDTTGAPFTTGAFTGNPGTLTCGTTYYSRAYATNSAGDALGAISASFTTSACGVTISGNLYAADETTPITSGTVKVSVAGGIATSGSVGALGAWSVTTGSVPTAGQVITVWTSGGSDRASLVFKYGTTCEGGTTNCAGLKLFKDNIIIGVDYNNTLNTITNTDLAACDNDSGTGCGATPDTDIGFTSNSGTLTTTFATNTLRIKDTNAKFAPGGAVSIQGFKQSAGAVTGGSANWDIYSFSLSGGSFTSTSGTLTLVWGANGNWTSNTGSPTFNANGGMVVFSGNSDHTINAGSISFNNVNIGNDAGGGAAVTITGAVDINGSLNISELYTLTGGSITVAGNLISTDDNFEVTTTTLTLDGSGTQTVSASGGSGMLPPIIASGSGTVNFQDTLTIFGDYSQTAGTVNFGTATVSLVNFSLSGGSFTSTSGTLTIAYNGSWTSNTGSPTFNANGGTIVFAGNNAHTINAGSISFNNVNIGNSSGGGAEITFTGTLDINGSLNISELYILTGGSVTVAGNLTSTDSTFSTNGATITLDGTGSQSIDVGSGALPDGTFTINKASGTATLVSNLTTPEGFTITAGTFSQGASYSLTTGGAITLGASGIWTNTGTGTITLGGNISNAGTITIDGNGAGCGGSDITITASSGRTWSGAGSFNLTDVALTNQIAGVAVTIYSGTNTSGNSGSWTWSGCLANITQSGYRWYQNKDAVQVDTALDEENTSTSLSIGTPIRLRFNLSPDALTAASEVQFKFQYATSTSGPWSNVGSSNWWDGAWSYRKSHIISQTAGAGTNYQVKITAHYGSGTDSASDVYLGNKGKTDFGDIRFTDSSDNPLSYWMESKTDSDNAVFWVKVGGDLTAGSQTIYMYYGNAGASTTSNGDNTFIIFDDFNGTNGSAPDSSKWTVSKNGNSEAVVQLDGSGDLLLAGVAGVDASGAVRSISTFSKGVRIVAKDKISQERYADTSIGSGNIQDSDGGGSSAWWHTILGNGYTWLTQNTIEIYFLGALNAQSSVWLATPNPSAYSSLDTFYQHKYIWDESNNFSWYTNSTQNLAPFNNTYLEGPMSLLLSQGSFSGGFGGTRTIDYVYVTKYLATEPVQATWGTEESGGASSEWLFKDNASVSDGATLTSALLSDSNVAETYQESITTPLNPNQITAGQKAEYDYSLDSTNAVGGMTYYFRGVKINGDAFSVYTNYPTITIANLVLSQTDYGFFANADSLTPGSALSSQNSPLVYNNHTSPLRLKISVSPSATLSANSKAFKIQWSIPSDAAWKDVGSPSDTFGWRFAHNDGITDGTQIPTASLSGSNVVGVYKESNASTVNPVSAQANQKIEYDFALDPSILSFGQMYYLRLVNFDGTPFGTYTNIPTITIGSVTIIGGGGGGGASFVPVDASAGASTGTVQTGGGNQGGAGATTDTSAGQGNSGASGSGGGQIQEGGGAGNGGAAPAP